MSDRELLELAAKAAGYSVRWYEDSLAYGPTFGIEVEPGNPCGFEVWNPLTDDGDALRLAVAIAGTDLRWIIMAAWQRHEIQSEREAATRLAIVRAAAELGRAMP